VIRRTFGSDLAHCGVSHSWRVLTLRVTLKEEPQRLLMKLEGKLTGPWVAECRQAWLELNTSLGKKKLTLDLCGVTFVDDSGVALLHDIHRATRAEMVTGSPLTKHFAEQATASINGRNKGE
jgi:ABC-type transporter Mla MlaB component